MCAVRFGMLIAAHVIDQGLRKSPASTAIALHAPKIWCQAPFRVFFSLYCREMR
jgi:hypothetical protein